MIILKLGGSLLTDKEVDFSLREDVLERVAREIREGTKEDIIIIHGGGSFGHPLAKKYALQDGYKEESQIQGVVDTRLAMGDFNRAAVKALRDAGIPAIGIQPSACIICRDKRIHSFDTGPLKGFLEMGMVPVLYGDVVADTEIGFCILSGDQIIAHLSSIFNPKMIILGVDVDGVFTGDPKAGTGGELVEELGPDNLPSILENLGSVETDVTGGMKGKVIELVELAEGGHGSLIVNAAVPERLKKALLGDPVKGTKILKGNYEGVLL